jgi:hypothetical protein
MAILDAQETTLEIGTGSTGSAVTITGITLTNPMILTATGHGLVNGDLVTAASFAGTDAEDINDNTYVVKYATDDTFAIELDASALTIDDNTDQATMTPAAWAKVGVITNFSINPTASERDRTTLADTERKWKRGIRDGGQMTFNLLWDNADTGLDAVVAAYKADTETLGFRITFSDDEAITLEKGYIIDYSISGDVDADATGAITIRGTVKAA